MTRDPIAAFFADAHRHWQQALEQDGLGDRRQLEAEWQKYLHECNRDRIETTHRNEDG